MEERREPLVIGTGHGRAWIRYRKDFTYVVRVTYHIVDSTGEIIFKSFHSTHVEPDANLSDYSFVPSGIASPFDAEIRDAIEKDKTPENTAFRAVARNKVLSDLAEEEKSSFLSSLSDPILLAEAIRKEGDVRFMKFLQARSLEHMREAIDTATTTSVALMKKRSIDGQAWTPTEEFTVSIFENAFAEQRRLKDIQEALIAANDKTFKDDSHWSPP